MSKLNKNSNGYIFGFALLIILVCGVLLSVVSGLLAEKQEIERELERKKFILKAAIPAEIEGLEKSQIAEIYEERVTSIVINHKGEHLTEKTIADVTVGKEYKKLEKTGAVKEGMEVNLPLYMVKGKDGETLEAYVLPTYGFGLWDNIWGYIALKSDKNTIIGFVLDHKGETPGLGARVTEDKVQDRYKGKQLYEGGEFASVKMMKGEGNDYSNNPHQVDGLSGATLTADGINNMLDYYIQLYQPYISKLD